MKPDRSTGVLRQIHALFDAGVVSGLTDSELLERFTRGRDEPSVTNAAAENAFAVLVARHGPMVLGVCRRFLSDPDDIEDAFQATFLILVRKAATVRVNGSLGKWVYGVARRVAGRARVVARWRDHQARRLLEIRQCPAAADPDHSEVTAIVDEELARLPEKYRLPLVLCCLVGLSNKEAAAQLRCPVGTVQSRLSRGREQLRARLERRGLAPSVIISLESFATMRAWRPIPAALATSTVRTAMRFTGGQDTTSELIALSVLKLAEEVLKTMGWSSLKVAVSLILIVGTTTATVTAMFAQGPSRSVPHKLASHDGQPGEAVRPIRKMKSLAFPDERSLGVVYASRPGIYKDAWDLCDDPWAGWERLADARGRVQVPDGHDLRLDVRTAASNDLSPLHRLNRDDLSALDLRGAVLTAEAISDISQLKGLRTLRFMNCQIDDGAIKPLSGLTSLHTLSFSGTPVGDDGLVKLAPLPALADLDLANTRATEKSVAILAKTSTLDRLDLSGTTIDDVGLGKLTKLRELAKLQHLRLPSTITDEGLRHASNLTHLKSLDLMGTLVGDAGLAHLGALSELQFIRLTDTKVTDAGLVHLKSMKSLKTLLPPPGVTDLGLTAISKIEALRYLWIMYSPVTDAGVTQLANLKHLETLTLDCAENGRITDESVPKILRLPRLKKLSLQGTGIGDEGLAKLSSLQTLGALELGRNKCTWDGLRHLSRLPALRELGLAAILGERPSLRHLEPLKTLERLYLNGNGRFSSDADLAYLGGLAGLQYLRIGGIPVTDRGMKHLSRLTSLRVLQAYDDNVKVGDDGLSALGDMKKLEYLWISGPVTNRGLERLETLESLRFLYVRSPAIDESAVATLRRKLPLLQEVRVDTSGGNR